MTESAIRFRSISQNKPLTNEKNDTDGDFICVWIVNHFKILRIHSFREDIIRWRICCLFFLYIFPAMVVCVVANWRQ